jgi:hypothetical protein
MAARSASAAFSYAHRQRGDRDPVGVQRLQAAKAPPLIGDRRAIHEGFEQGFVVSFQGHQRGGEGVAHQPFDYSAGVRAAVDRSSTNTTRHSGSDPIYIAGGQLGGSYPVVPGEAGKKHLLENKNVVHFRRNERNERGAPFFARYKHHCAGGRMQCWRSRFSPIGYAMAATSPRTQVIGPKFAYL